MNFNNNQYIDTTEGPSYMNRMLDFENSYDSFFDQVTSFPLPPA